MSVFQFWTSVMHNSISGSVIPDNCSEVKENDHQVGFPHSHHHTDEGIDTLRLPHSPANTPSAHSLESFAFRIILWDGFVVVTLKDK